MTVYLCNVLNYNKKLLKKCGHCHEHCRKRPQKVRSVFKILHTPLIESIETALFHQAGRCSPA